MTMTLIEGVGDEVTLFFVLAVLALVACLAWWTTLVADRPLRIQTIIVGQRVIHVDEQGEPAAAAAAAAEAESEAGPAGTEPPGPAEQDPSCEEDRDGNVDVALQDAVREEGQEGSEDAEQQGTPQGDAVQEDESGADTVAEAAPQEGAVGAAAEVGPQDGGDPSGDSGGVTAGQETGSAVTTESLPDSRQQLRQRRLAFMARQAADSAAAPPAAAASCQAAAPEPVGGAELRPDTAERTTAPAAAAAASQAITVRLKFLNDTQRLVEGSRAEPLADFKRRHFPAETAANRIVRLIFNGRVLPDQETLDQCGLYHNCVVHCHVSAEPRPAAGAGAAAATGGRGGGGDGAPGELDIGVLLYPVLTSVVTLVWGLRLRYPELFSGMAVLLLAVLTLLLACFAAATFLPLERLPGTAGRQQQRGR